MLVYHYKSWVFSVQAIDRRYQDCRMNYWAENWVCSEPMLESAVKCLLQVAPLVQDVSKLRPANSALPDWLLKGFIAIQK